MQFEIKAVDRIGKIQLLTLDAASDDDALRQAGDQGYAVLAMKRQLRGGLLAARKHAGFQLNLFTQELLALLAAGLVLVEAIETLNEKEQRAESRQVLLQIVGLLKEGKSFSDALQSFPGIFPALYIATVRASEKTGDLQQALRRYAAYQEQADQVKKKLVNASIYPALLMLMGSLVFLFLLGYVVPRFSRVYEAVGSELPLFSRLLLQWGQFIEGHALTLLLLVVAGLALLGYLLSRTGMRHWLFDRLWQLPVLGVHMHLYQLARFYRMLGMLLVSGIPVVPALGMVAGLLQFSMSDRLQLVAAQIAEGKPLSQAMHGNDLTTPVVLRMLRVGEKSGQMGAMMEHIAKFYEDEIAMTVERFTRLFEPVLMAFIGLLIGAVVVLMYLPIFELAGSIR
ncbi:type II secretion system F family protein [Vogesella facilis]|uniref:Type II secretion system F family protein n=1 Tax=Vogesella facilis TaxID=1655232 RepID=A0ABV7RD22_9NEIS